MDNYKIFETNGFLAGLQKDFSGQKGKIRNKLLNYIYPLLRKQPYYGHNIKKLVDYEPPTWRYRLGNYRLFYTINEKNKTIVMLTIDSRQSAYN